MLTVPDEESLARVAVLLRLHHADTEWFYEPDLDDELTAVAAAGDKVRKRLARLPLLLREEVSNGGREHVVAAG
jgi:hypothetical protein